MDNTDDQLTATADNSVIVVPSGKLTGFLGWFVRSRAILRARLEYAQRGWWTFPAPLDGSRKSLKSKKYSGGVNWGSTTDPKVIRKEFRSHRYREQNIGVMTGIESGIFVIDTDTAAGHGAGIDGEAKLREWEAAYRALPKTLMQESPSGSIHYLFEHPGSGFKVKSFSNIFGPHSGVDCKGDGGMIIATPSTRPDRFGKPGGTYRWINPGHPIAKLPLDHPLYVIIIEKPPDPTAAKPSRPAVAGAEADTDDNPYSNLRPPPRDGVSHWEIVNQTALANLSAWFPDLFPGGAEPYHDGYRVTSKWLKRDLQEDISALPQGIKDFGIEEGRTPINLVVDHLHVDKLEAKAWLCEKLGIEDEVGLVFNVDEVVEPSTPAASFSRLDEARAELERLIGNFIQTFTSEVVSRAEAFRRYVTQSEFCDVQWDQDVWAIKSITGLGKTGQIILKIAAVTNLHAIYAVPNHDLSSEIMNRFLAANQSVKRFLGRDQDDSENPGIKMCLKSELTKTIALAHMPVSQTCCSSGENRCEFFDVCGYQRQKQGKAKVIVIASDTLFHDQASLGYPDIVVIDESIWKKSLRGVDGDKSGFTLPFAKIEYQYPGVDYNVIDGRRHLANEILPQAFEGDYGGLQRQYIEGMHDQNLHNIMIGEWMLIKKLTDRIKIHPALPEQVMLGRLSRYKTDIQQLTLSRNIITLLEELREMKRRPEIQVSGRILIEAHEGIHRVRWRGVAPIVNRYRVPTMILDATLPDIDVLQAMFPDVEIVGDISVDFPPNVQVRQYLGSPTSASKLVHIKDKNKKNPERHLIELRRFILRRHLELDRQPTLVIVQKSVELWLKDKLPKTVEVRHYNAIEGLDTLRMSGWSFLPVALCRLLTRSKI